MGTGTDATAPAWQPQGPTSSRSERAAMIAAMTRHPDMPDTLRELFVSLTGLVQGNRFINVIMSDRARLMMGWLTLFLDAGHDPNDPSSGLTVNRFKVLCARAGLSSPGRAAATLGLMRFAGYIAPTSRASRGLPLRLVPTDKLIAPQRERLKFGLTALSRVRPAEAIAAERLDDPVFFKRLMRCLGEQFLERERLIDHAPALAYFAERKGGILILMAMMLSAQPDDPLPPSGPVSASVKELARRGLVARAQVRELLRGGVEAGLLVKHDSDGNSYRMAPQLRADAVHFVAAVLLLVSDTVLQAQADIAQGSRPMRKVS